MAEKNKEAIEKDTVKEIVSFIKTLVVLLILAIFIRASVVEAYKIPSGSMKPTLQVGDHILVNKLSYGLNLPFLTEQVISWSFPKRGDVVVFTRPDDKQTPQDDSAINIIKRVIGLPGDLVEVRGTTVYINNQPLKEPYAIWAKGGSVEGEFPPTRVPPGNVFLMGDNRDESNDSRYWSYHFLPAKRIKGRAFIIYWSSGDLSRIGTIIR